MQRNLLHLVIAGGFFMFAGTAGCASAGEAGFSLAPAAAVPVLEEEPIVFTADSGERVDAFQGYFKVPENRNKPDARMITIGYVRFPATGASAGSPVVYLAGGPGGSGIATAKERRFPLFMAMREFGDVIALDQRGVGVSDDLPRCRSSVIVPEAEPVTDAEITRLYRMSVDECAAFWEGEGVDPTGYTTVESVYDLEALRQGLGAEKITLWGISYGSHLAFAALARIEDSIDRVVIASAEGLDQTVKLPARTDAYFSRLQAVIDSDPAAKAIYPDIKAMMRRVHARLENEPVMLDLPQRDDDPAPFLLEKRVMQRLASGMISDPDSAVRLMQLYRAVDAEQYAPVAQLLGRFISPREPISWSLMPLTMDCASGISDARLALVEEQAKTGLLGDILNFPMPQLRGCIENIDLGDEFRRGPESRVPTLLLTGTLDGRTYPEGQREATAGLRNLTTVTVVNAGHNLFMTSPDVTAVIQSFMRGDPVPTTDIILPPPDFSAN